MRKYPTRGTHAGYYVVLSQTNQRPRKWRQVMVSDQITCTPPPPRKINTDMNQDINCYMWSDFSSFSVIFFFFYSQLFQQWEEWAAPQGKYTVVALFPFLFFYFHFSHFITNLPFFVVLRSISEDFKVPDGMVGFSMYLFKNPKPQNAH